MLPCVCTADSVTVCCRSEAAAAEVGAYDNRLASLDTRLALLTLMVGGLYALILPAFWLLLRVAYKTGALT